MNNATATAAERRRSAQSADRHEASFTLVEVMRLMRAAFAERMKDLGLTGSSWRILVRLARQDGMSQVALARRVEITAVAVGEAIDRLERSGHVERRPDPKDRRKWRIHLTKKSVELMPTVHKVADALQAELFQDVSAEELAAFRDTLGRIRARIHELKIDAGDDET